MYLQAVVWTVLAWFAGLILDANLSRRAFYACACCFRCFLWGFVFCVRFGETDKSELVQSARRGFSAGVFYAQISVKSEAQRGHIMRRLAKR